MQDSSKSRKTTPSHEVNWKIREIFSEAALACFRDEIDNKFPSIANNKEKLI